MSKQHIVVCEPQSLLTASLEREFLIDSEVTFRWFADTRSCLKSLTERPADLVLMHCDQLKQVELEQLKTICTSMKVIAFTENDDFEYEALLREIGAASVFSEQFDFLKLLGAVKRLLQDN